MEACSAIIQKGSMHGRLQEALPSARPGGWQRTSTSGRRCCGESALAAYCATPKTGKIVPVSTVLPAESIFLAVFSYFSSEAFIFGFLFSFFGERGERSAHHVLPIAPLGQACPVPERNRELPQPPTWNLTGGRMRRGL